MIFIRTVFVLLLYPLGELISLSPLKNELIPLIIILVSIVLKVILQPLYQNLFDLDLIIIIFYVSITHGFILACVPITLKQLYIQWKKLKK